MNKRRGGKYDGTAERKQSRGSIDEKLDAFVQLNPKVDYDITNGSTGVDKEGWRIRQTRVAEDRGKEMSLRHCDIWRAAFWYSEGGHWFQFRQT